jgi:hypothetical protein
MGRKSAAYFFRRKQTLCFRIERRFARMRRINTDLNGKVRDPRRFADSELLASHSKT